MEQMRQDSIAQAREDSIAAAEAEPDIVFSMMEAIPYKSNRGDQKKKQKETQLNGRIEDMTAHTW